MPPEAAAITEHEFAIRVASVRPETLNEQARTVEVVLATEDPVVSTNLRTREGYLEVLRMDGAKLPAQIPLLNTHDHHNVREQFGSFRNIRVSGDELLATMHVSAAEEDIWTKVKEGHLRAVSVGRRADALTPIRPGRTDMVAGRSYTAPRDCSLYIVTKWEPGEGSLTWRGSDSRTTTRTHIEDQVMDKELRKHLETIGLRADATDAQAEEFFTGLKDEQRTRADEIKTGKAGTPPDLAVIARKAIAAERDRVRALTELAGDDVPAELLARATSEGWDENRATPEFLKARKGKTPPDPAVIAREAIAAERDRVRALTELAGDDVPAELLARATTEGWDENRATPEFLKALRERRQEGVGPAFEPTGIHSRSRDVDCNVRSLAAGTLMGQGFDPTQQSLHCGARTPLRGDNLTEQDADRGERFAGMSAPDLFRECLRLDTGRSYLSLDEAFYAAREAPSGGSLAYVFGTNVYAKLAAGWETTEDTTGGWCDEEDVANFLEQEDITVEDQARLERLARGGTANDASISDKHETYKIARYAKKFGIDEQDILDDRLGAIMRMPGQMGKAARRLRPDLVYSIMLENPTLVADSGAVFNATAVTTSGGHANLGTGALGSATLKAAITAMGKQRDDENNVLNITPRYLIFPAELSWLADELLSPAMIAKLFADVADPQSTTENLIARRRLIPVMDDRLGVTGVVDPRTGGQPTAGSDTNWFLAAGGSRSIRVAYRRGTNRSPLLRSNVWDKGQWGMGWDINLDIGAAFMDFRGWYKSTGAA